MIQIDLATRIGQEEALGFDVVSLSGDAKCPMTFGGWIEFRNTEKEFDDLVVSYMSGGIERGT